ncbi:MAG: biotin--[acetyl-CoA-carboxylase] ligase [Candidatus Sericytochromatia bacterium]|nr:biotin--[acetyl-CoA-carboxylase] ligase [Candidatus Sericytochromatia bacterium]
MKWQTRRFVDLPSTQSWLKQHAAELPEGTCIYARQQSAGQGRQTRTWHSAAGGLYFSFLLKPASLLPELPWALWWACLQTLEKNSGLTFQLKAPNDILWQKHKLAGMLVDSQIQGLEPQYYICGVGFNLNQIQIDISEQSACSLWQITKKIWSLESFLVSFQDHFAANYQLLTNSTAFERSLLLALGERKVQISYNKTNEILFKEYWHEYRAKR